MSVFVVMVYQNDTIDEIDVFAESARSAAEECFKARILKIDSREDAEDIAVALDDGAWANSCGPEIVKFEETGVKEEWLDDET